MPDDDPNPTQFMMLKELVGAVKVDTEQIRTSLAVLNNRVRENEITLGRFGERLGTVEQEIEKLRLWDRGQAAFTAAASVIAAFFGYGR